MVHGGLIPAYVRESVRIAEEERPGPSLLELPEDVAREQVLPLLCCMLRPVIALRIVVSACLTKELAEQQSAFTGRR